MFLSFHQVFGSWMVTRISCIFMKNVSFDHHTPCIWHYSSVRFVAGYQMNGLKYGKQATKTFKTLQLSTTDERCRRVMWWLHRNIFSSVFSDKIMIIVFKPFIRIIRVKVGMIYLNYQFKCTDFQSSTICKQARWCKVPWARKLDAPRET